MKPTDLATAIAEFLTPHLQSGETMPDVALLHLVRRGINAEMQRLVIAVDAGPSIAGIALGTKTRSDGRRRGDAAPEAPEAAANESFRLLVASSRRAKSHCERKLAFARDTHSPLTPANHHAILHTMHTTKIHQFVLSSILLGFSGAAITGACAVALTPDESACSAADPEPPVEPAAACAEPVKPCMRYRIQLQGDPTNNAADRAKYKLEFGSACYVAATNNAFNCYYEDPLKACAAGFLVPKVYGAAEYQGTYPCVEDKATGNYTRQVGSDKANVMTVYFEEAPLETSLIEVDGGAPLEVNGPYRNLVEVTSIEPGKDFYCTSGQPDPDGGTFNQRDWILQVNRNANGGKIRSDLAGFMYPCKKGCIQICTEPEFLKDPKVTPKISDPERAEVHHEVRAKDLRGCKWGTNANSNAVVISRNLNIQLKNYYPSADEVLRVNQIPPYTP